MRSECLEVAKQAHLPHADSIPSLPQALHIDGLQAMNDLSERLEVELLND